MGLDPTQLTFRLFNSIRIRLKERLLRGLRGNLRNCHLTFLFYFVTLSLINYHIDVVFLNIKIMINQTLSINNLPDLLTVREVAQILRVSPLTIKRWGKRGKLPAIRINSRGDRRYKKEAVLWLLGIQAKEE